MFNKIKLKFTLNERGQGLVEYALILVLVAIVVIAVLLLLGPALQDTYCKVANALQAGSCTPSSNSISASWSRTGPNSFKIDVTVSTATSVTTTITSGPGTGNIDTGTTPATQSCNTACSFNIVGVSAISGTAQITAGSNQTSVTYIK